MNIISFDELLEKRIALMRKVLAEKNKEYASDEDKLHNFKRAGDMRQTTPEDALVGMWTKHIISILDIVDKLTVENKKVGLNFIVNPKYVGAPESIIKEKIGDAINYLVLLEALLEERVKYGEI